MSASAEEAQAIRGSLLTLHGLHFRLTARCVRDDLELEVPVDFAQTLDGPVGKALFSSTADDRPTPALELSRPTGTLGGDQHWLVVFPSAEDGVLWIVACGLDAHERCSDLDRSGSLWPTEEDRALLAADQLAMDLCNLQIKAPLALSEARRRRGEPCEVAGLGFGETVTVMVGCDDSATYAAVTIPQSARLTELSARRHLALTLACIHPDATWEAVDVYPEGRGSPLLASAGPGAPFNAQLVFRRETPESTN